jgi:hypothetical protein
MCVIWGVKIIKSFKTTGLLLAGLCGWLSCATKFSATPSSVPVTATPDYASLVFWAAHPGKFDPSDEIPRPLRSDYAKDSSVDVFFIHPTTYTNDAPVQWNADMADKALNEKTDNTTILYQASAFNRYNVYAPRYRQAHIESYYTTDTANAKKAFDLAYSDIKAAFEYYMQNYNQGKPIIIASHSQGTTHSKRLLKEFFEGKELQKKLVAAYILGIPVDPEYFSTLQPCHDSLQTGCFVTWRTFRRGYEPNYAPSSRKSVVVNPLTWTTDTLYAPVSLHKGAVLRKFNRVEHGVGDAQVYKDLLWISRPKFKYSRFYNTQNYHIGDINLFYLNVRENLVQRVAQYRMHP